MSYTWGRSGGCPGAEFVVEASRPGVSDAGRTGQLISVWQGGWAKETNRMHVHPVGVVET